MKGLKASLLDSYFHLDRNGHLFFAVFLDVRFIAFDGGAYFCDIGYGITLSIESRTLNLEIDIELGETACATEIDLIYTFSQEGKKSGL